MLGSNLLNAAMVQHLFSKYYPAQLLLSSDSTGNRFTALSVSGGILTKMAGDKVTEKSLICLPKFSHIVFNKDDQTIVSFSFCMTAKSDFCLL